MNTILARRIAGIAGLLGVALGAFGAHGLDKYLASHGTADILKSVDTWKTGILYHLVHAVMLAVLALRPRVDGATFWSFVAGMLVFSGSLYILVLTGAKWLGQITPLGGVALMVGWACLAFRRQE